MSNFLEFTVPIKPVGNSKFSLIEDKYLKGGFRVVDTLDELDSLDSTTLKLGMLVAVNEENGAIYECVDLSFDEDDFGDPITSVLFEPIQLGTSESGSNKKYERFQKEVKFTYVSTDSEVDIPVDMKCRSFILTEMRVTKGRKVKVKIFTSMLKDDPIIWEFDSSKKSYMDGSTYLSDGTRFQYKQNQVFINKEKDDLKSTFIINCISLEDSTYNTSSDISLSTVNVYMTYIPLES